MRLVRLSVKNPVFVNLLMVVILIWGFVTYQGMSREAFPEVSRDIITIITNYPGAPPTEMEQLVTVPIENSLTNVNGIDEIESHSVQSRSVILLKLHPDADDADRVLFDVQKEIDQLTNLPDQADEPEVDEVTTNFPVVTVGLNAETTESNLYSRADSLQDRFRGVKGVSDVKIQGKRERKIWVDVDHEKSRHYDVYLPEIFQSVKDNSLNQPGGRVTGPVREVLVRTIAKIKNSESARQQITRSGPIRSIKIDELASVYPGFEKWETRGRIDGHPGVSMTIFKKQDADAISLVQRIDKIVKDVNKSKSSMSLTPYRDLSEYVKDRLDTMIDSAFMALVLVLIVLFLTLNGSIAVITSLGIPVSVYGSFIVMNYYGITINMISLFGFIIVLGIIVDDAIVITENIYRYMEMGHPPDEAAVEGTRQVYTPVLATIATNIIAFIPLTMVGGLTGKFMIDIPLVVTIALLVSLFEAFVILPSHMADFVQVEDDDSKTDQKGWREAWVKPLREFLTQLGSDCLRYRYHVLAILILLVPSTLFAATLFPKKFFHLEDIKMFRINMRAPTGSSLEQTASLVKDIESKIENTLNDENLRSYISSIGWIRTRIGDLRYAPERAQIEVELTDPKERSLNGDEILRKLRDTVQPFPRAKQIDFVKQQAGPPTGQPVEIEITGPKLDKLRSIAQKVRARLDKMAGSLEENMSLSARPIFNIQDNVIQGKSELRIRPLSDETGRYGITNRRIAQTANLAVRGLEASSFQSREEEIEVMVRMDPSFTRDPDNLKKIRVPASNGRAVPLGELATMKIKPAPGQINRIDRSRSVMVSASVDKNQLTGARVNDKIRPFLEDLLENQSNYDYKLGGEYEEQNEAYRNLGEAFLIALLIIYTILAGLFNSFLEPFVIVLTVPFSFIGVLVGLFIMGKAITFTAALGTVALAGIVVNDALILLKFIDDHQTDSTDNQYISTLRAIRLRVRPVLITTLTTIVGLAPIGFEIGLSGVESFLSPMAIAIMYGLAFATLVTLIIVPVIYLILVDIRRFFGSLLTKTF